jgi:hypothetical protein
MLISGELLSAGIIFIIFYRQCQEMLFFVQKHLNFLSSYIVYAIENMFQKDQSFSKEKK